MSKNSKEYTKKYYWEHLEKSRESSRQYGKSLKGREIRKKYQKYYAPLWRVKNRKKLREIRKRYRLKYPESDIKKKWFRELSEKEGKFCKKCGTTENLTLNHKVPKCIGGKYSDENLEILCMKCNIKEYNNLVKKALKFYFKNDGV